jgi:hypothetical protein
MTGKNFANFIAISSKTGLFLLSVSFQFYLSGVPSGSRGSPPMMANLPLPRFGGIGQTDLDAPIVFRHPAFLRFTDI